MTTKRRSRSRKHGKSRLSRIVKFIGLSGMFVIFAAILLALTSSSRQRHMVSNTRDLQQQSASYSKQVEINHHSQDKQQAEKPTTERPISIAKLKTALNEAIIGREPSEEAQRKTGVVVNNTEQEADQRKAAESDDRSRAQSSTSNTIPVVKHNNPSDAPKQRLSTSSLGDIKQIEISRGDITSKKVAITFDAGASPKPVSQILSILAKHHIKCTFFLTGKWMEKYPDMARGIISKGHEIGNHSYSHRAFTNLSAADIAYEIAKTDTIAQSLTGESTKPLLRVPYGARDKRVLEIIRDQGYKSIYWDIDSWDSVKANITPDEICKRVLSKIRNGSIVLMHCGSQASADCLDQLLTELTELEYEPVTVGELIGIR